jgi:hypothetical protein
VVDLENHVRGACLNVFGPSLVGRSHRVLSEGDVDEMMYLN